jgi:hypothetical protein
MQQRLSLCLQALRQVPVHEACGCVRRDSLASKDCNVPSQTFIGHSGAVTSAVLVGHTLVTADAADGLLFWSCALPVDSTGLASMLGERVTMAQACGHEAAKITSATLVNHESSHVPERAGGSSADNRDVDNDACTPSY